MFAYELDYQLGRLAHPHSQRKGGDTLSQLFIRREVALMGSSRWAKVLRFVLVLAAVAMLLAYIAPIKAY